jgi:uncharacterized repeat protein (TIGR01451 family)
MFRNRLAVLAAAVVFSVLAGTGVAAAYWSTHANVVSTVTAGVVGTAPNCSAMTSLVNGSFESPDIATGTWTRSVVTGWSTGDPAGVELWDNLAEGGNPAVPAANGAQLAEINGNFADTLSQVFTTTPGQTLTWSLQHRGRAGVDTMTVAFGPTAGAGVVQGTFSDGKTAWGLHSGTYVVPAGQTTTKISLVATGSAGGDLSYGNFVDDVKVNNGPCLSATTGVTNVTRGGTVNYTGDEIRYTTTIVNKGGSSALNSTFTPVIPTGATYKPGSLTIGGVAKTDAADADTGKFGSNTVTAYLGTGATSSAGGTLLSAATTTVTFSVIITSTAASGSLSFSTVTTFADPIAPAWPITASPFTIGTSFSRGSDLGLVVLATPTPATGSATSSSWTYTLTNNGPDNAAGTSVLVTFPTGLTVSAATVSGGVTCAMTTATTRTCTVGTLNAGLSRVVTLTGTVASTYSTSTMAVTATVSSTSVDGNTANNTATNTATVTDGTNPGVPGTPTVAANSTTNAGATLNWTAASDNFGSIAAYTIYRTQGATTVSVGTVSGGTLTFTDTSAAAATTYTYTIRATDPALNVSAPSGGVSVTTLVAPPNGTSYYEVRNTSGTDQCMRVLGTTSGSQVTLSTTCTVNAQRDWRFVPTTGGYVKVNPRSADTMGLTPDAVGVNSIIELGTGTPVPTAQEWKLVQVLNQFQFQSRSQPTLCIDRNTTTNVISLQICSDTDVGQLWAFAVRP